MSHDTSSSAPSTAATSHKRQPEPIPASELHLSESAFLQREADRAKQALSRAWRSTKTDVGHGLDPRAWTGEHPWIAMSVAAVAGFVTAAAVVPSEEERLHAKLEKITKALYAHDKAVDDDRKKRRDHNGKDDKRDGGSKSHGMLGFIGTEVIKLVRPTLMTLLSAYL